jgi:hypothetical protein
VNAGDDFEIKFRFAGDHGDSKSLLSQLESFIIKLGATGGNASSDTVNNNREVATGSQVNL